LVEFYKTAAKLISIRQWVYSIPKSIISDEDVVCVENKRGVGSSVVGVVDEYYIVIHGCMQAGG
jgi:hypothetical protein